MFSRKELWTRWENATSTQYSIAYEKWRVLFNTCVIMVTFLTNTYNESYMIFIYLNHSAIDTFINDVWNQNFTLFFIFYWYFIDIFFFCDFLFSKFWTEENIKDATHCSLRFNIKSLDLFLWSWYCIVL